jgi:hypothetical protein
MMSDESPNEHDREPRLDDNDPVWRLLGESPRPEPDAWFTVRTMAKCRYGAASEGTRLPFTRIWRWALGGCLGLSLVMMAVQTQVHRHHHSVAAHNQPNVQEAFEVMASFNADSDTDADPSTPWQDSAL